MKVVSTEALTKLIQLVKSAFVKVEDVVETSEVTLADVAVSGDYDDLINKPTNMVTTNTAQTISANKTFTGVTNFQNGSVYGCIMLGADVSTTSVSNDVRKIGRMLFHTYENTVNCVFVSTDSNLVSGNIDNKVEFGGRTGDQVNTAPDMLRFTVANSHNSTTAKTHALEISYSDGANFAVQPKYNNVNLATETYVTSQGYITSSALSGYATQAWVGQQGYITGISSSDVTTALGYTPYNSSNPSGYITSSALTGYEQTSNKVTSISSSSTDTQYPSAKCVYDIVGDIETLINAL